MAKHHTGAAGAATAKAVDPIAEPIISIAAPAYEQIASLAYQHWQERGRPDGSPEEDWLRAEAELQTQATGT